MKFRSSIHADQWKRQLPVMQASERMDKRSPLMDW